MSYIPNTAQDQQEMLKTLGIEKVSGLFKDLPEQAKLKKEIALPSPLSELELAKELADCAQKNSGAKFLSFLGAGCYHHFIPAAVKAITGRAEFYTAYTPYQPEISQGTLQAIFEYQSLICRLTAMDVANASLYDGATALAEAASLAIHYNKRRKVVVPRAIHPGYLEVLKTYGRGANWEVVEAPFDSCFVTPNLSGFICEKTAAVILQQPNFFGSIEAVKGLAQAAHAKGALLIVSANPISLGKLKPPGEYGADLVTGEGQVLGSLPNFGGPGLGIFAVKQELMRLIPGRLVGETLDKEGKRAFVLTLQAREQHIRREKASSNICSNEALVALAACVYLSALGKQGLQKVAGLCLQKAHYLKNRLAKRAAATAQGYTFHEFVVKLKRPAEAVIAALRKEKILAGVDAGRFYPELKNCLLVCVTEIVPKEQLDRFAEALSPFI